MGRKRNDRKLLDAREKTARLLDDSEAALDWRMSLIASDSRVQEQILVTAPSIEAAERAASAVARHNGGRCEKYLVERIHVCAEEGCEVEMLSYDPRYTRGEGAPTVEEVEDPDSKRWCAPHGFGVA